MLGKYFSFNGKLLPIEQATVNIDNLEFTYGFGVYENFKVRKKFVYFPEQHCSRLLKSATIINLKTTLNKKTILNYLSEFVKKIDEDSFNVKILLMGNKEDSDIYIFASAPKYLPKKFYSQGIKVITYHGERQFPQAKTLSMLQSYIAFKEAKEKDAYDALMVHEGKILEGTRANLFFTDGKKIFTAPKHKILDGVTRSTLISALEKENIKVKEKILELKDLNKYSGFFLTSTSSKVLPISQINDIKTDIPEIIKKIIKIYDDFLKNYKKS